MATLVYKYGLVPTSTIPKSAIDELFRANRLWNTLVEHDRAFSEKYRELTNNLTAETAQLSVQIDGLSQSLEDMFAQKRKIRAASKRRNLTDIEPDLNERIANIKGELKALKSRAKEVRAKAREENAPLLDAHYKADADRIKAIVKESGCVWSNHELIYNAFDVARKKARKENATLNFHRFDGSGRWGYRVSGGFKLSDVHSGKKALFVGQPKDADGRQTLPFRMRVCDDENGMVYADFDLKYHRPLPANALIKAVVVKRERIGDRFKHFALFTIQLDDATDIHHNDDKSVGIDVGFLRMPDGALRVATAWDGQKSLHFDLPAQLLDGLSHVEDLQSQMQSSANEIAPKIQQLLVDAIIPEEASISRTVKGLLACNLSKKTYSHHGLRKLASACHYDKNLLPAEVGGLLSEWMQGYLRQYREANNLSHKLLGHRDHIYRNWAAQIAQTYGRVSVESLNLRELSAVKDKDDVAPRFVRNDRKTAALYSLLMFIEQACNKYHCNFSKKSSARTTSICSECFTNNEVKARYFVCSGCGTVHNQDENAAKNLYNMDIHRADSMDLLIEKHQNPQANQSV